MKNRIIAGLLAFLAMAFLVGCAANNIDRALWRFLE
jgi:hypothetical protein